MKISKNGLELIKKYEGLSLKPYVCPAGHVTIGYGNTYYPNGKKVLMSDKPITKIQAEQMLEFVANKDFASKVEDYVIPEIGQSMIDALVSFAYNVGVANFKSSTLLKKVNAMDYTGAKEEFKKWNKAGNRVLPGLTKRRAEEAELFGSDLV